MSEQLIQCDHCHREFSARELTEVCKEFLCPRCALKDEIEFCWFEGLFGKAVELEAKLREMDKTL